jgi:hypothetical protein
MQFDSQLMMAMMTNQCTCKVNAMNEVIRV